MRFVDHSRVETDHICPRARCWEYEHNGTGIKPVEPNIDLIFGGDIATAVQAIRMGLPVPVCSCAPPHSALYLGLVEAYRTRIWPVAQEQYELVCTEREVTKQLAPDILYQARPDAIVKRKSDGTHWYIQDKTTSQDPQNFCKGWDKHAELHATAIVVEEALGIEIAGIYVQGWYKGYLKNNTLYSPLAYAWSKRGQPGLTKDQWSFEYRAGWERRPVTEVAGGVAAWVKSLPDVVVQQQFPVAGPISLRRDLAQTYFRQVKHREFAIGTPLWTPIEVEALFPQHFSNCDEFGKWRRPCAFRDCCWAPTVGRDPIGSGMFTARQPHHEAELRWFGER